MKWLLLLIATILLSLPLLGYQLKILRREKPSPEVTDWGTLFIDGIKCAAIVIIYHIPLGIIRIISIAPLIFAIIQQNTAALLSGIEYFWSGWWSSRSLLS